MDVRELILDALSALQIDQAGLAKRLQRGQPTISRWVSGSATPDYESCLRLAKITGIPARRVLEAAGLDPYLIPADPDDAQPEVDARRQAVRDQFDRWIKAVGEENETYFWNDLKAKGDSTVHLIRQLRTAVSTGSEAPVSADPAERAKRGRQPRNGRNGPLGRSQHPARDMLAQPRSVSNERLAA